jgi:tripartite-type tricarboxylate transporter receptor subunit TctC
VFPSGTLSDKPGEFAEGTPLKRLIIAALAVAALSQRPVAVLAQGFPDHAIKIVVPNGPGGGADLAARVMADAMSKILGQSVIVENKVGSGSLVGTDYVARAAPDGYTLALAGTSNLALNLGLYPKLPYDPIKDFASVGLVVTWPFVLVARKDFPQKSLADIIDFAKANQGKVTYASAGIGTGQHIASALTAYSAGVSMTHVPYGSAQAAYPDVISGRVDLFFDNVSTTLTQVRGGAVRPIAVSSAKRYPVLPDLPTVNESGKATLDMTTWFGLFAPSATPKPVLDKLRDAVDKARSLPEMVKFFEGTGGEMNTMSPAETEAFVKSEATRWTKQLRDASITAQ